MDEDFDDTIYDCLMCGAPLVFLNRPYCSDACEDKANELLDGMGTCQGCGLLGPLYEFHSKDGHECGQYC